MKRNYCFIFMILAACVLPIHAQQLPNSNFDDWSGEKFDSKEQPASWFCSNVTQAGFSFNFAHKETGRSGNALMVQDQDLKVMGIGETSPGYVALGHPWVYLEGLNVSGASAGTYGGINWTYRPDTLSVWIKRTGNNISKEDYHILYYAWSGTAKGEKYKAKDGNCSEVKKTDEESDIRLALDGNECGTLVTANQIAEGWWRERKEYANWTNIRVPIYYMSDATPEKMNVIFSASNYPNFRANDGLYAGNSLYIDDVELIYTSNIDVLLIDGKEWKGFDPGTSEEQTYSLGEKATAMPTLQAIRGRGSLKNARGTTVTFPGRTLSGSEISIKEGQIDGAATEITVSSPNAKPMTYKIKFVRAPSTNSRLAGIQVNGEAIRGFNPYTLNYNVALPYGTTATPVVAIEQAEDAQTVQITQPTSVTGKATIVVTAADKKTKSTYTIQFSVAALADNTLQDILVNGESLAGFTPGQTIYRVSLPIETTVMPSIKAVSRYKEGEQTIRYTAPDKIDGGTYQIAVTTPGNQTPKTYKLNFKLEASSYSLLKDLKVGDYITNFEPNLLTYYVHLPLGTTELPEITYVQGDAYQKVTIENGGLDGTTRVIVTPASGEADQTIYKIVITTEKSEISSLKNIFVGGVALPGFDAQKTSYTYELPVGTTEMPEVTVEKGDEYEQVKMVSGGLNGTTRITVTAGNGNTTVYQIAFSVLQATDPSLNMIYVGGEPLAGYNKDVLEYTLNLPVGVSGKPVLTWDKHDDYQTVTLREPSTGVEGDYRIVVKPQSGATRTYIIHVTISRSSNTSLAKLSLTGYDDFVFDAAVRDYTYTLPEGVSQVPAVVFEKAEESQRVISVLNDVVQTIRVTAEDGSIGVYTITFVVQKSANALLDMIYLDGVELAGFDAEKLSGYTYTMTGSTCPVVTVKKADERQQVTILTPAGQGRVEIQVQPESGAGNTYYIDIVQAVSSEVRLESILANGVQLADWNPETYSYTVTYDGAQPEITYVAREGQQVTKLENTGVVTLVVRYGQSEARYVVTLSRTFDANAALKAIYLDGQLIDGFEATKLAYEVTLAAGSAMPKVTYEALAVQTVTMGQTALGETTIRVVAENGASQNYVVRISVEKHSDPTLLSLKLNDEEVLADFDESGILSRVIEKGQELPTITYVKRDEQATVSLKTTALQQQVLVRAENGASKLYTINYTEHDETNALLSNIRIYDNGKWMSLPGFDKNIYEYSYDLAWTDYATRPTVVPCVWPVSDRPNQVVTITYGGVNDNTILEVLAEDGQTQRYTIRFTRAASKNTLLGKLEIGFTAKDVTLNEQVITLAYEDEMPQVEFTAAEAEQTIEYYAAPRYEDSRIVVTAENGDKRTYTIHYAITEPEGENLVKSIAYSYKTMAGEAKQGTIAAPAKGENIVELPYGATDFVITGVEKNYEEQSIALLQGGVRRTGVVIAMANQTGVADARYEVVVRQPEYETSGKLSALTFKGVSVPNFQPYVYNYVVRTSETPTDADFAGVAYDGKTVTKSEIDHKKKQVTLAVADGETYSICWFYEHTDWFDFSQEWVQVKQGVGYKPSDDWTVPGDCAKTYDFGVLGINFTYTTGKEVNSSGANGVMLSTIRGASLQGSIPAMMTLGQMAVKLDKSGNSTSSVTKNATDGKDFKNTPEALVFRAKPLSTTNITNWKMWLTMSDGTKFKESNYTGDFNDLNVWRNVVVPISYEGVGVVSKFNVMLNGSDQENAKQFGGSKFYESSVIYDNIHFLYNSEIVEAYADGQLMTKDGNRFTLEVGDNYSKVPVLTFVGAVHDQMQTIEWQNGSEWVNGELTAKVTNYGENGEDKTEYEVVLKHTLVTDLTVDVKAGTEHPTFVADGEYQFTVPNGARRLPNLTIEPKSIHQQVSVSKQDWTYTVTVKNEAGETATYSYTFVEEKSNDATLASLSNVSDFAADKFDYSLSAESMPQVFTFVKTSEGQTVDAKNDGNTLTVDVTAEDGTTKNTYTVTLDKQAPATSSLIEEIRLNGTAISGFRDDKFEYQIDEVVPTSFVCRDEQERVVEKVYNDSVLLLAGKSVVNTYKLATSTELSGNAYLRAIRVNKESIADFEPTSTFPYVVKTNEEIDIEFVPEEAEQTIQLSLADTLDGYRLKAVVTAENGTQFSYIVIVRPDKSNNAELAEIRVNDVVLPDFQAGKYSYTVTLPTTSPKTVNPQYPSISYLPVSAGAKVTTEWVSAYGEENLITVLSEDETTEHTYSLTVAAEPSHCLDLAAIVINGTPVANFKPGRTFYSAQVATEDVTVEYSTEDAFQTITVRTAPELGELSRIIEVKAEDGQIREYELEIWKQTESNDANLAAILLDGTPLAGFEEKTYSYTLPLEGTTRIPDISAQLKEDGQTLNISESGDSRLLTVTAPDGITTNVYKLNFSMQKSSVNTLRMIYLGSDELSNFEPTQTYYEIALPVGVKSLPTIMWDNMDSKEVVEQITVQDNMVILRVTAENGNTLDYQLRFAYTLSSANTLQAIWEDGVLIDGFDAEQYYYNYSLPVGQKSLPDITYMQEDAFQRVSLDTIVAENGQTMQLHVLAENGFQNTYTLVYTYTYSKVDTLTMIYVGGRELEDYAAQVNDYTITLPYGETQLPTIDYIVGDAYQTVQVDTLAMAYRIVVTAEAGVKRTYAINFVNALSDNATLSMIYLDGKALANFDAEQYSYVVRLAMDDAQPRVTADRAEDAQRVDVSYEGEKVFIDVTAENGNSQRYTVTFLRTKSENAQLSTIMVAGTEIEGFEAATYEYTVMLPYGTDELPEITAVAVEKDATVSISVSDLQDGLAIATIEVTAPDEETILEYIIMLRVAANTDCLLTDLRLSGRTLEDFRSDSTLYVVRYELGTKESDLPGVEAVTYTLSDENAVAVVQAGDNHELQVIVLAEDGETSMTYRILQEIAKSDNCYLKAVFFGEEEFMDFDPEVTDYTYFLVEGQQAPMIVPVPEDERATADTIVAIAGDTINMVRCYAEDGSVRTYTFHFPYSAINSAVTPGTNDVFMKVLPGCELFFASIRSNVSVGLYDMYGHMVGYQKVPVANPNDVYMVELENGSECLVDVTSPNSGCTMKATPDEMYFYVFFEGKRRIKAGKVLIAQ